MSITRFTFCILLAASVYWTGCEMFASHTNPVAGWKGDFHEPDAAITKDYQDYINNLPSELRVGAQATDFLEDGTGQHAVHINIAVNGTWWNHVLIYDKNDKRIKVVKYISGNYGS